ncbi:hypothetical protein [Streptomyces sp. NPDC029004]|uniref:hypothetical protein n=1 Tax=Streptomyces sp. NPDC029004 TaxID=3154490 RepID=UPI0033EC456B
MTVRTAWLLSEGQTREDTRLAPVAPMAPETATRIRDGVLAGGNPFAATGAGAMDLQIGAGRAMVQGTDAQGAYPIALDAPVTVQFAGGDAQFGRIDAVALRVYDQLFDTSGQNLARVEIIPGTPSATPTAPNMPSAALRLWDVTVPAGASAGVGGINWAAALADRRRYTAAAGGIIPRGWGLAFDGAYDGQYRDNGGVLERWSGPLGVWQTYRAPSETPLVTTTGATASTGYSVTSFHARRVPGVQSFTVAVQRTGTTITSPAGGNIADQPLVTLPPGWRPPSGHDLELAASDGFGDGTAYLNTAGLITLRAWVPAGTIQTGRTIRMSGCFVT